MNPMITPNALAPRRPASIRAALRVTVLASTCFALLLHSPAQGGQDDEKAVSQSEMLVGFTSWYLRINEYLFDGREFKKIIALNTSEQSQSA